MMTHCPHCHDARYDYVDCTTCGDRVQRIDFRGNPHAAVCPNPQEAAISVPMICTACRLLLGPALRIAQ